VYSSPPCIYHHPMAQYISFDRIFVSFGSILTYYVSGHRMPLSITYGPSESVLYALNNYLNKVTK